MKKTLSVDLVLSTGNGSRDLPPRNLTCWHTVSWDFFKPCFSAIPSLHWPRSRNSSNSKAKPQVIYNSDTTHVKPYSRAFYNRHWFFELPFKGILLSGNEVSQILLSLVMTYFGGHGHRPRLAALGVLFSGVASIVVVVPHFVYGQFAAVTNGSTVVM